MDLIKIGIYSEHKLLQDGLISLISNFKDIFIELNENSIEKLVKRRDLDSIHILVLNPRTLNNSVMNLIVRLQSGFPKLKILILSSEEDERDILKTIKAGAKGFLGKESDSGDILEALYTLRGGHDYYSKSITQILLKKYINNYKSTESDTLNKDINCLSSRELEVLKLWGDSYTNNEISETLYISVRTVESHKNHIMQKLNMKTAVDLVKFAIRNNIIEV